MKKTAVLLCAFAILFGMCTSVSAYKLENSYDIYKAEDIVIDGELDDWDAYRYSYIILPTNSDQVSYFSSYAGPEDLSAFFRFAWSSDGLYMAGEVYDNSHNIVEGSLCWQGDSVQFAGGIDNVYGPEFTLTTENTVYCDNPGNAAAGKENIVFITSQNGNTTVYEVFFPWTTLGKGKPDEYFPFCICINENDGFGRVGWIETSAGLSNTKSAAEFSVLKMLNRSPEANDTGKPIRPEIKDITVSEQAEQPKQTIVYEYKTHITYPDIETHWARTAIDEMASRGIVRGIGELYYPGGHMTRAEFLAVLVRTVGLDLAEYSGGASDITASHWCAKYFGAAAEGGLIPQGFMSDGSFKPDEEIKREEMIALMCNSFLQLKNKTLSDGELLYSDTYMISEWAVPYIKCAQQLGLISGNTQNMICPKALATRAEVAVMANNFIKLTQE